MCVYLGISELPVCIEFARAPKHKDARYQRTLDGGSVGGWGRGGYDSLGRVFLIFPSFV